MQCCLCEGDIQTTEYGWELGHNAQPIQDGRCCTECNVNRVIPQRLDDMIQRELNYLRQDVK